MFLNKTRNAGAAFELVSLELVSLEPVSLEPVVLEPVAFEIACLFACACVLYQAWVQWCLRGVGRARVLPAACALLVRGTSTCTY